MEKKIETEEEKEEKICESIENYVKCDKKAIWKVIGYSAQLGVPKSAYVCLKHKDYTDKHSHPYNRGYDIRFIPLSLGKCCGDMESAINTKFLAIKNEEIVFNIAKTPQTAGNVLTGEKFDPKNYPYSMTLSFCCFCSSRLSYIQNDDW